MYYSVGTGESKAEISVKHSKFIAFCSRVSDEDQAEDFVRAIKKRFSDATHAPYAYVLGERADKSRASDDGEPSGTSGVPILETIKKANLTFTAVVVVRYFGGIKLGTGGLAHAYADAATEAIRAAGRSAFEKCVFFQIACDYGYLSALQNQVYSFHGSIQKSDYGDTVSLCLAIPADRREDFLSAVADLSSGKAVAEEGKEGFYEVEKC